MSLQAPTRFRARLSRLGFWPSVALVVTTFLGVLLGTGGAVYALLGHDGVMAGGGLVLILVPLVAASIAAGVVGDIIFRVDGKPRFRLFGD